MALLLLPIFIILYGFTGGLSNDIYLPAMPSMTNYFGTNDTMVQLSLTAWGLGLGSLQLFMGPWSDHYGRRPVLVYGGLLFIIGTIACALAPNVYVLLLARFVQGIGTCSLFMLTFICMKEIFTEQQRVKWMVYNNMMRSLAPLIGPVLGAYILLIYSWRGIFMATAILGILALAGLLVTLPETNPNRPDTPFSLKNVWKEYCEAFRNHYLIRYLAAGACVFGGMMVYLTSGAFIMIDRIGLSEQMFSYTQVAISGAYILGAACIQPGYRLLGANKIIRVGIVSCILASLGMLLCFWHENIYTVLIPVALYSFGFGISSTPIAERALAHEGIKTGLVAGLMGFSITIGAFFATFATSLIPATGVYTGLMMLVFSGLAALIFRLAQRPL